MQLKYYALWSLVHGLISINIVNEQIAARTNKTVLDEAIAAIMEH